MPLHEYTERHNQAALVFQAHWRGRHDRLQFRKSLRDIEVSKPAGIPAYICGNEPVIPQFTPFDVERQYVYVGTGGLQNLNWICGMNDELLIVPKFYLVDYSIQMTAFWFFIKDRMIHSTSYTSFYENIHHFEQNLAPLCAYQYVADIVCEQFMNLESLDVSFEFLKELITKMTIVRADWRDENVFRFIRQRTDKSIPIIVYASNILEFLGNDYDTFQRDFVLKEGETSVTKVLNTLSILEPEHVIHTRTSHDLYYENGCRIRPDKFIIISQNPSVQDQLNKLSAPELGSLYKPSLEKNAEELSTRVTL